MTLYELLEKTEQELSVYKNPPTALELAEKLDPVLQAAGLGSIGRDTIKRIDIKEDTVYINTEYVRMGCSFETNFEFPGDWLYAEDPVQEAKLWKLGEEMQDAEYLIRRAQEVITRENARIKYLAKQREALTKSKES